MKIVGFSVRKDRKTRSKHKAGAILALKLLIPTIMMILASTVPSSRLGVSIAYTAWCFIRKKI
jgi:hypothetical protein